MKILGIDTGSRNMGLSLVNDKGKILDLQSVTPSLPSELCYVYWFPFILNYLFQHKPDEIYIESVHIRSQFQISGALALCPIIGEIQSAWLMYGGKPKDFHIITPAEARKEVLGKGNFKKVKDEKGKVVSDSKTIVQDYYVKMGVLANDKPHPSHIYDSLLIADCGLHRKGLKVKGE